MATMTKSQSQRNNSTTNDLTAFTPPANSHWLADHVRLKILQKLGLSVRMMKVKVKNINYRRDNRARLIDVDLDTGCPTEADHVKDIRAYMVNSNSIPVIVLLETSKDHYQVLDGNHRLIACIQEGYVEVYAYVVSDLDELLQEMLPMRLNIHGNSVTEKAKRQQAAYLHDDKQIDLNTIAFNLGINIGTLRNWLDTSNVESRLVRMTLSQEDLNDSMLRELGRIQTEFADPHQCKHLEDA